MKLHALSKKLNTIFVTNLKWQHQETMDSFSESTQISSEKFAYLQTDLKKQIWKNI